MDETNTRQISTPNLKPSKSPPPHKTWSFQWNSSNKNLWTVCAQSLNPPRNLNKKKDSKSWILNLNKCYHTDFTLLCIFTVIDHRWCQNMVGTTKVAHEVHASVSLMFLPHLTSTVIYWQHWNLFYMIKRKCHQSWCHLCICCPIQYK